MAITRTRAPATPTGRRRTAPAPDASVAITHPEKVLFPDDGITKGELAAYYDAVAPVMLPHLRGRPITLERYPNGIAAKGFIQKSVVRGCPAWLERITAPKEGGVVQSTFEKSVALSDRIAARLVAARPRDVTQEFRKNRREDRIFVDTARNRMGATVAAAYTVRALRGAPVSAPCTWDEISSGAALPQAFTLKTMAARLATVGDLWEELA